MKKLEYKDGFCLYGEIEKENEAGVWFKTKKETSFISYDLINRIRDVKEEF